MAKKSKEVIQEETVQEEIVQEETTEERIKPFGYEPSCNSLRTWIRIPDPKEEEMKVRIVDGVDGTILHEYHEQKECLREIFSVFHYNLQSIREVIGILEEISNAAHHYLGESL